MSLALVSNPYLDEQSAKIRAKPVPWEVVLVVELNKNEVLTYIILLRVISGLDW